MTYATGGTVTESGGYRTHTFTSSGTLTVTEAGDAEVLVVAGGGGGGRGTSTPSTGGGGGAGGVLTDSALSLSAIAHTVTVGSGGAGATSNTTNGSNGDNSSIGALAVAIGGGGGGGAVDPATPGTGGSGGGGLGATTAASTDGAAGTVGQGNSGGDGYPASLGANRGGGGGGGAGSSGAHGSSGTGGDGGSGVASSISGSSVTYGGGGGGAGGGGGGGSAGSGGSGGGGAGASGTTDNGTSGTANTGGGGGGTAGGVGGAGGSGIVIVRYAYSGNTAPDITAGPTVSYGTLTRTGPQNTPAVVSFTATDAEEDGADEINWGIYTATAGGGTEIASGTCTSGVQEQVNIAYNASGISEGSNTLYLLVDDGTDDDEESFTLLVDNTAPVTFSPASNPSPVDGTRTYAVDMTAEDATSTGTDELTYQVRTAASGAGDLLASGTRTSSGTGFTTASFADPTLAEGSNTRYVRVIDGAGNVREESFTVTGANLPVPVIADTPHSRPRARAIDLITVAIYRPLGQRLNGTRAPLDVLDINPNVTALSWSSVLPGGWSSASVGIAHPSHDDRYHEPPRRPWLPREMAYGPFYHVEIRRHGRVLFAGRMWSQQRSYGVVTGFSVRGYAMTATHDMYYRNSSDTVVSTGTLLRAMIAASAPHLVAAPDGELWQDPGTGHAYDEFNRMYLADVLDQVSAEGDSAGNIVDWMVYEDQMVQLKTRAVPQRADYLVPWTMVPDFIEDSSGLIGVASYERTSNGTPTASSDDFTNPDFAGEHGFQRGHMLQLGELSINAADAMTRAYLELHRSPVSAASIVAGPNDRLESPGGREMPREAVRAGQWVQIEGMDTPLVIVSTDYDAFTDVVRIQAGEFVPDFALLLSTLEQDRRKRQRLIRPQGGRER